MTLRARMLDLLREVEAAGEPVPTIQTMADRLATRNGGRLSKVIYMLERQGAIRLYAKDGERYVQALR